MPARKDALLNAALEHFAREGLTGATLRPLARSIGTSARLLVYHFESKENLVAEAMAEVQARFMASFRGCFQADASAGLMAFWDWISREPNLGYYRLLLEAQVFDRDRTPAQARRRSRDSADWLALIQHVLPPGARSPARAAVCAAIVDGLLLELLSTGDRARAIAALKDFDILLRQSSRATRRPTAATRKSSSKVRS